MAFDQTKYVDDYVRDNYDRLSLKIPKGKKAILQELAIAYNVTDDKGKFSVTRLLIEAVEDKYHVDLSRQDSMLPNIPTAPAAKSKGQGR